MASKKKLLQAAAGAAGGEVLDIDDVFSTYLYDGTGSPKVIENGIALGNSNDGGSARFDSTTSRLDIASSTDFNLGTGDFTIDFSAWWADGSQYQTVFSRGYSAGMAYQLNTDGTSTMYVGGGGFITDSTARAAGNWYQYCITRESGTVKLYVNGTLATTTTGNDNITSSDALNIGDDDSTSGYGINGGKQGFISNFRIIKGSAVAPPNGGYTSDLTAVSGTVLLTCQGDTPFVDNSSSSHSITKVNTVTASDFGPFTGSSGEGGMVWTKNRDITQTHFISDTERGATKLLSPNNTDAQETQQGLTSFNSNGFTVNNLFVNNSGDAYVSWTFRKARKLFDVVTWTGDGTSPRNISHSLGSQPGMMIVKRTSSAEDWTVYHRSLGATKYLNLNGTQGAQTFNQIWADTEPTSTQFTVGNTARVNTSGETYVAYLFAHNDGDGDFGPNSDQDVIKCGSYTGSGNANGPEINLGFEPQWVLIKNVTASGGNADWNMFDNMRGLRSWLQANRNYVEDSGAGSDYFSYDADGFTVNRDDISTSGQTYAYMAIRRGPLAEPESATDVFEATTSLTGARQNGDTISTTLDYADWHFARKTDTTYYNYNQARITGWKNLSTNATDAEASAVVKQGADQNKLEYTSSWHGAHSSVIDYFFKRAPGFFDVVAYSGTGSARTVSHNLGVVPEMMWVKSRSKIEDWSVYHAGITNPEQNYLYLNNTGAVNQNANTIKYWNHTNPTSSVFSVGDESRVNASGHTYIAYLFATVAGVSKVGSFSHTSGQTQNIDCGFSSGARFVLVKQYGGTGNWFVYDTARGIVAGNDPRFQLNTTAAQNTANDDIDPLSSGFTLTTNFSGGDYIFYAIA